MTTKPPTSSRWTVHVITDAGTICIPPKGAGLYGLAAIDANLEYGPVTVSYPKMPHPCYVANWFFAHPAFWANSSHNPDVVLGYMNGARRPRLGDCEDIRIAAQCIVNDLLDGRIPDGTSPQSFAKSLMDGMKIAEIERAKVDAGYLELF